MAPRALLGSSLARKLGAIGAALLVLALASVGLTLWVTWQLEGGAAAVNEAGRLRMQTWRLAQTATVGDVARLQAQALQFDASLALLASGDPARPLLMPGNASTTAALAAVRAHWQRTRASWLHAPMAAPAMAAQAEALVADVEALVEAIENQLARWTALLSAFQLGLMGLAIAGGVTVLYAGHLFVFQPLARLQGGLAQVERGELDVRVPIESDDEFGRLAQGFNRMATTLQGLYRDLQAKVLDKSANLAAERERLRVLCEASAFMARAANLHELAHGFAQRLCLAGRAQAVRLRWRGATEMPGDAVAAESRALLLACSGAAVAADAEPGLRVPIRLHEQHLGEAEFFFADASGSAAPALLGEADRALLESLAAHLASGMESLRAQGLEREAAVGREREALARELHDSIAQALAFLKIQLQLLRGALKRSERSTVTRCVDELDTGVRECTGDVRELLLHFRTRAEDADIVQALQTTLRKFQQQSSLPVHLQVQGHGLPLANDVQLQLLHIIQEALSNVRKHAQASQVWLDVQREPGWRFEVRDDGVGFAGSQAADETHVGLRIMRERAAAVGAQVEVVSGPGQGTRVVLSLPPGTVPSAAPGTPGDHNAFRLAEAA